ncbi:hypothetical protein PENSPDRAFT_659129 [Peniophora sp. CONT]|nr:hypothetical protein PENSPDRAFT_659129 [Peniophora sp. CONT]
MQWTESDCDASALPISITTSRIAPAYPNAQQALAICVTSRATFGQQSKLRRLATAPSHTGPGESLTPRAPDSLPLLSVSPRQTLYPAHPTPFAALDIPPHPSTQGT